MKKPRFAMSIVIIIIVILIGISMMVVHRVRHTEDAASDEIEIESQENAEPVQEEIEEIAGEIVEKATTEDEETEENTETASSVEILQFVDVYGEEYEVDILPTVEKQTYVNDDFIHNGDKLTYEGDDRYTYKLGVDVSHHQGNIDWQAVKKAGIDFAFLRIGYRGYGTEGTMNLDRQFEKNIREAQAAGIDVGVYFFAQAVNEEEAKEEAEFVIAHLQSYDLQLPVVYDPESILDAEARTDNVTAEQFTKNTKAFCEAIEDAGYDSMIYSNMLWEAYQLDLTQLTDIPIWYADYEMYPQTPYYFTFWQYSNRANVDGIQGSVDMDIWLIPIEE
jgi:GH25 family lysozyme M1 (1,4-beta-N-acetylmuramidase)